MDFWATYCLPCAESAPEFQELYEKYHPKGFEVVGISVDAFVEGVAPFVKKSEMKYTILLDPDQDAQAAYGLRGLPETFLLGRDGRLINRWVGYDEVVAKEIPAAIQAALEE